MKRILLLSFSTVFILKSWAKGVSAVYSNFHDGVKLECVNRTADYTMIHLCCHAMPGEKVTLPASYYLSDERGRSYPLLTQEGGRLGEDNVCSLTEKVDFFLYFSPLDRDVCFFDLLSSESVTTPYSAWGIHDAVAVKYMAKYKRLAKYLAWKFQLEGQNKGCL